jgi:hypothetical protein
MTGRREAETVQTVVTPDSLELLTRLCDVTKELLSAANALKEGLKELNLGEIRPALLNTEQAARYLGISPNTLKKYRVEGRIGERTPVPGHIEIGTGIFYEFEELNRHIREDLPHVRYRGKSEALPKKG